jgi:hypothetical protein
LGSAVKQQLGDSQASEFAIDHQIIQADARARPKHWSIWIVGYSDCRQPDNIAVDRCHQQVGVVLIDKPGNTLTLLHWIIERLEHIRTQADMMVVEL